MTLTLTTTRRPDGTAAETRTIEAGAMSIGRTPDNDWMLADPERHLSKRHCVVTRRGEIWELADFSANGTFVNGGAEPVGRGKACELRDGDRLALGGYEVGVKIVDRVVDAAAEPWFAMADENEVFAGPVQADHSPGIDDAFRPPQPCVLLGDDWDLGEQVTPSPAPAPPPALVAPQEPDADLLGAFLRGAELGELRPSDPERAMEALGAAFRAMAGGLREALMTRAAVKGEFRIAQTMVRARGNNPLKFAASEDDVLHALVGIGRRTEMAPAEAVTEALADIRLHELATMSAMQSAVRTLLRGLDPSKLREAAHGGMLAAQHKARAWDLFEAQHGKLSRALSDDFDGVFGAAFAQAYEDALREARAGTAKGKTAHA